MAPTSSSPGEYRIRHADDGDGRAVERELRAYLAHIGAALDAEELDHDIAQWRVEYDGVSGALLVVEDPAGQIVGTAGVRRLAPGLGELKRMWIRPASQGAGLGRQLMERCLDEARRLGFRRMRLDTQRRMTAAIRLYESYGFREVPDYNGNPRAEIWMENTLASEEERAMASQTVVELRRKSDAAWANLSRQLQGMDAHLDRSDAPGEWTTREILGHLLFEPGFEPSAVLKMFADRDLPAFDVKAGDTHLTPERQKMSLRELVDSLEAQRRSLWAYLDGQSDAELGRKARIPLFKQFMGTDEIPIPMFVGAMFDYHWNDHAAHIAKIRKAAGLPEAT